MIEEEGVEVESARLAVGRPHAGYSLADVAALEGRVDLLHSLAENRQWAGWEGDADLAEAPVVEARTPSLLAFGG